ncbi:MAG: hypothetical protein AAGN46_01245 [Acidobacteriota bacterium]
MSKSDIVILRGREATAGTFPSGTLYELAGTGFQVSSPTERTQNTDAYYDGQPRDHPATGTTDSTSYTMGSKPTRHGDRVALLEEVFQRTSDAPIEISADIEEVQSGNLLRRSSGWGDLRPGMAVYVRPGDASIHLLRILSISGNDAAVDPDYLTIGADAAPAAGALRQGRRFTPGLEDLYSSWVSWDRRAQRGHRWGWGVTESLQISASGQSPFTEQISIQLGRRYPDLKKDDALGAIEDVLPNTIEYAGTSSQFDMVTHLGDRLHPAAGFGVRFDGTVLDSLFLQALDLTIRRPARRDRGGGRGFGADRIEREGEWDVMFSTTFLAQSQWAEEQLDDIEEAAKSPTASASWSFGWRNSTGDRRTVHLPSCLGTGVQRDGRDKSGPVTVKTDWKPRVDPAGRHAIVELMDFAAIASF